MQVNGMKRLMVYEDSSGKSIPEISLRSISCGYDLIICDYSMSIFML